MAESSERTPVVKGQSAEEAADFFLKTQADHRSHVLAQASRVLDALLGKIPGVSHSSHVKSDDIYSAPEGMPILSWPGRYSFYRGEQITRVGNVGEYYTSVFKNERPSDVFNTGFYAAVLAVKHGLVNPDLFFTDRELKLADGTPAFPDDVTFHDFSADLEISPAEAAAYEAFEADDYHLPPLGPDQPN